MISLRFAEGESEQQHSRYHKKPVPKQYGRNAEMIGKDTADRGKNNTGEKGAQNAV